MKNLFKYGVVLLILSLGILSACSKKNDPAPPSNPQPISIIVSVSGSVVLSDSSRTPLMDVNVSIGNKSVKTDSNGGFLLNNISTITSSELLVSFNKPGFANNQRYVNTTNDATDRNYVVDATLSAYQSSTMKNLMTGATVDVMDPSNTGAAPLATITFPANSINVAADVEVNVVVGDPSTDNGRAMFPGDYRAMNSGESSPDTLLESVAFLDITVMDQGQKITQLDTPADVQVKLPEMYQINGSMSGTYDPSDNSKNFIEWWSYDEIKGTWMREDADTSTTEIDNAVVVANTSGILYAKAKISHFSWWNADRPITQHACVCVIVVDENGNPLQGARVIAQGTTYNGTSSPVLTDKDGKACVNVKRSLAVNSLEKFRLSVSNGGVIFKYDVTNANEGDITTDEINSPTTQGSTLDNSGSCNDLDNTLLVSFKGTITGKVTIEGGTPAANQTVYSSYGPTATTDTAGNYTISAPIGVAVNLSIVGTTSRRVTVPDVNPFTVDFVIPNQAPIINSLVRTPGGIVAENSTVTITASATDPEGKTVTYAWSTTTGSLSATTGTSVVWTAPAGDGTATVSLVVSDGIRDTADAVTIPYSSPSPGNGNLKLTFLNDVRSNTPVAGVVVALYEADNKTIKTTLTSGVDGITDFGAITGRATLTVVSTIIERDTITINNIDTYVDINPVTSVYYLNEDPQNRPNNCNQTFGNINVTGLASNTIAVRVPPLSFYKVVDVTTGAVIDPTLTYCSEGEVQTDGNISLLVNGLDSNLAATTYGFILDQIPGSTTAYPVTADKTYSLYSYTSPANHIVDDVEVEARYKGIEYSLNPFEISTAGAGTISVASTFPADLYHISSWETVDLATKEFNIEFRQSASLPTMITPSFSDITFTANAYDSASKTLSWTFTGNDPTDLVEIGIEVNSVELSTGTFTANSWDISLSPTTGSFSLPDLPPPADSWVNVPGLNAADICAQVIILNYDFVTGFDEYITSLASGTNFDTQTSTTTVSAKSSTGTCEQLLQPAEVLSVTESNKKSIRRKLNNSTKKFSRY